MQIKCFDANGVKQDVQQLYQWDMNPVLVISDISTSPLPIIQFSNSICEPTISVNPTLSGGELQVTVPSVLLEHALPLYVYLYQSGSSDSLRTIGAIYLPVVPRVPPEN